MEYCRFVSRVSNGLFSVKHSNVYSLRKLIQYCLLLYSLLVTVLILSSGAYKSNVHEIQGTALSFPTDLNSAIQLGKLIPMVIPESNTVSAGNRYKAKVFLAVSMDDIATSFIVNQRKLKVDKEGFGDIEFTARGGNYNSEGVITKSFKVEFQANDQTYSKTVKYNATKPVIQFHAESMEVLYRNCSNKMEVSSPSFGSNFRPAFKAEGGTVMAEENGIITIIPKFELMIFHRSTQIDVVQFKVKTSPKPTLVLRSEGKHINQKVGVRTLPKKLTFEAVADDGFARYYPEYARYIVSRWEVILARGRRPLDSKIITNTSADIGSFVSKARSGDRIIVEAKEVQRIYYEGGIEIKRIDIDASVKTIPVY